MRERVVDTAKIKVEVEEDPRLGRISGFAGTNGDRIDRDENEETQQR